uniref:Dehydrogenase/reductase SDR family member on chromosome X n=1 Tax=Leptobrachium leishanense TaxID=445787 RepID=A0A8C5P9E3_9ANUR
MLVEPGGSGHTGCRLLLTGCVGPCQDMRPCPPSCSNGVSPLGVTGLLGSRTMNPLRRLLLPLLRVYYMGMRVALEQLLRRAFTLPDLPMQHGRVAIITGGSKGIGYCTALHLAKLGMHVIIAGNHESEGIDAVRQIQRCTQNTRVEFLCCDLTSMKSIRKFVQNFEAKNLDLHVLVNNAGVMLVSERRTQDGFEEHFGLNYLGHFLLTNLLLKYLKRSGACDNYARVVTVSSATHYVGELNFDDLQSSCCYSPHGAYAQSKLALVLFSYYLQNQLMTDGSHVTANVVDPGVVNTDLYMNVNWAGRIVKWLTAWLLFKKPPANHSNSKNYIPELLCYIPHMHCATFPICSKELWTLSIPLTC